MTTAKGKKSKRTRTIMGENAKRMKDAMGTALRVYRNTGNVVLVCGIRTPASIGDKGYAARYYSTNRTRKGAKKHHEPQRLDKIAIGFERGWRGRPKNPWMTRAYYAHKPRVVGDFRKALVGKLEKEAVKLARAKGLKR